MLAVLNVTRGSREGEFWPSLSTVADLFTKALSPLLPEVTALARIHNVPDLYYQYLKVTH